ncbi:MAG TPA: hypothetical protein VD833_04005 [Vicinamibacterales bacterium]|nr:hypothetical protein [Vicinamibacterales bacterium]
MRADLWTLALVLAIPPAGQRGVVNGVSVPKSPVEAGVPVEITVTGTNPCGAVRLDYGDGTERITHPITQVPTTIRYIYKQPGRYEVRAEGMGNCDGVAGTSIQVMPGRTPAPPPPAQDTAPQIRFREMDANGDGVITRAEWRGDRRAFRIHDANGDGILSGEELRVRADAVVVKATERWTNTGIYVREGQLLRLESTGTVQLSGDPGDTAGPGGAAADRRAPSAPLASRAAGALIARIGEATPLFVGSGETLRAPASGQLYLGVNDDHLADNRGEFQVRIQLQGREQGRR